MENVEAQIEDEDNENTQVQVKDNEISMASRIKQCLSTKAAINPTWTNRNTIQPYHSTLFGMQNISNIL